jgi:hypothetical protein
MKEKRAFGDGAVRVIAFGSMIRNSGIKMADDDLCDMMRRYGNFLYRKRQPVFAVLYSTPGRQRRVKGV